MRIVVMGVAGSGKSTVGELLAGYLDAEFVDGDDLHGPANVAKMAAGKPLTDDDRRPWLERLRDRLASGRRVVVASSALKRSYRDVLRGAGGVRFVHLDVARPVLEQRLADRTGHFMSPAMLASQLATLEPPADDERDVVVVPVTSSSTSLTDVVEHALAELDALPS